MGKLSWEQLSDATAVQEARQSTGLGLSQTAEVAYLEKMGWHYQEHDVTAFEHFTRAEESSPGTLEQAPAHRLDPQRPLKGSLAVTIAFGIRGGAPTSFFGLLAQRTRGPISPPPTPPTPPRKILGGLLHLEKWGGGGSRYGDRETLAEEPMALSLGL